MANENQDNYAAKAATSTPSSADGAALGSATAEYSDLYLATEGVVYFGDAQDVSLTHNDEVGLTLSGTGTAVFVAGSLTDGTATLTSGNLTGAAAVTASGAVTGGSLTDGTATLTSGALSGVTTINSSGNLTVDTDTLFVDASGNKVGIGTISPDYTLDVHNPSGAGMYTIVASDTTAMAEGVGGGITFRGVYNAGTSLTEFASIRAAKSNGTAVNYDADLVFLTRANGSGESAEHMRIDSSGKIGIGTDSPDYTLDVKSPAGNTNSGMYTIVATDSTSQAAGVGGGITFRGVYNAGTGVTEFATIRAAKSNGSVGNYDSDLVFLTRANGSGDSTEHMRIDAVGNVGIGTSTFDGSAVGYLAVANGTEPASATADQVYIGSKDASTSSEATLALFLEEDPAADVDIMQAGDAATHKLKVWINGVEYYIALQAV